MHPAGTGRFLFRLTLFEAARTGLKPGYAVGQILTPSFNREMASDSWVKSSAFHPYPEAHSWKGHGGNFHSGHGEILPWHLRKYQHPAGQNRIGSNLVFACIGQDSIRSMDVLDLSVSSVMEICSM